MVTDTRLAPSDPAAVPGDLVVVGVTQDGTISRHGLACLELAKVAAAAAHEHVLGSMPGDAAVLLAARDAPWPLVMLVRTAGVDAEADLRLLAETAGQRCRSHPSVTLSGTENVGDILRAVRVVVDGFEEGRYAFLRYKSPTPAKSRGRTLTIADGRLRHAVADAEVARRRIIARWVTWVRDLVNTPARDLTPRAFASEVMAMAQHSGVVVHLHHGGDSSDGSWDALDVVGAGSPEAPAVVELRHGGPTTEGMQVGLVGKGVTFDSGGLDLKSLQQMRTMKQDMAGAAVVAGATFAAAELGLDVRVRSLLALVENMPGGSAVKPGDVVRHRDGSTTEVVSPDAEGRLILADALHYLREQGPDAILDVATLTGGGGLGPDLWAVVGNDPELVRAVLESGDDVGDRGWQLPLVPGYGRFLRSEVADRRNIPEPTRYAFETLAATAFLSEFVGMTPWAHLDISAVAGSSDQGSTRTSRQGATGRPMRAVVEWLTRCANPG